MVLETPLLRVSRSVAACSRCRSAKVKCDGKLPACTACEKANRAAECLSTNDEFARGKERSYVTTLETRVERLEKKLAEARSRRLSSTIMTDADISMAPRPSLASDLRRAPENRRAERRKEASEIDDLVSDFGLLAVNATARDFHGFTSQMSYARLILAASSKEALPARLTKPLPPRYAATPLIQHYLNTIFILLPIFEEASLYTSVDAVYHSDSSKASPFDIWTVRMVLAISSLALSDERGDARYLDAVGHLNAALEKAEDVLHPGFVSSIQALVLLVEYASMDPHHFDSWTLIGAASRAMVDLGMHQDPSKSARLSKSKLELRRRIYYCVYSLDRSTAIVQTRAFSFSDDSANVALPFGQSIQPLKKSPKTYLWLQSFDAALVFFKLRELQSEWYTRLFQSGRQAWENPYPYLWKTYQSLTEWFQSIPESTLPSTRAFFELELLYSYVYVLSPSPRCPRISNYAQRMIFEHCIAYATNMLAYITSTSADTKPPLTFCDAMRTYMTGRQFVDVLIRNQDVLLNPVPPAPPANTQPSDLDEVLDPLSPPIEVSPPPLPAPVAGPEEHSDPTSRAIKAINDFMSILSRFGVRFGYINWRDRFQHESTALLTQLYHRLLPTSGPPSTMGSQQTYPSTTRTSAPQQQQQQQRTPPYPTLPSTADRPYPVRMPASVPYPQTSSAAGTASWNRSPPSATAPDDLRTGSPESVQYRQQQPGYNRSPYPPPPQPFDGGSPEAGGGRHDTRAPMPQARGDYNTGYAWETRPGGSMNVRFS